VSSIQTHRNKRGIEHDQRRSNSPELFGLEPEYREPLTTPAPAHTPEELALQLAGDPEFQQWAYEIRHTMRRVP
jgi:hypothetical protein